MSTKKILCLAILICPLLTACTIGIVQRKEVIGTPGVTAVDTPTSDPAIQATIGALSTQNAALATQVAANDLRDATPAPTAAPTAIPTPPPTRPPTKTPAPTPTPCTAVLGVAFQPRLGSHPEITAALGCPLEGQHLVWTAEQVFQRGRMFWKQDRDLAYILFTDSGTYQVKDDPYVEGDPDDACPEVGNAPAGLYKPVRGFNRQWCGDPDVRDKLGWALAEEMGFDTTWQAFEHGLVVLNQGNHIFVMYNDGTWDYVE